MGFVKFLKNFFLFYFNKFNERRNKGLIIMI